MHSRPELHLLRAEGPGVEQLHRAALALVHVLVLAAAAEGLRVLVDDVGTGGRQRRRKVLAAADEHVAGERRRGCPAPVETRRVHVDLVGEAGEEVADLWATDEQ